MHGTLSWRLFLESGVPNVHILDYSAFRDAIFHAIREEDLYGAVDEAVFLNTSSRGCEVFFHPFEEPKEVWGKVSFEWVAENQALYDELRLAEDLEFILDSPDDVDAEVMMQASFHLHFGDLSISTEAVRDVAEEIKALAEAFFGDDGGVIAEVSMTSAEARLECLRFEVNTSAPFVTDEPWWDHLADVCRSMLDKLQDILSRLRSEFGSSRG